MNKIFTIPGLGTNGHAYLFLTLTTLCWGGNAIFSRLAVGEVSPLTLVTLRWTTVLILLLIIARKDVIRDWPVLKQHLGYFMAMGGIGFTGFNALFYIAAHTTTAVNIGIIQGAHSHICSDRDICILQISRVILANYWSDSDANWRCRGHIGGKFRKTR